MDKQYKKYQWVEAEIEKSTRDSRPESYKIVNSKIKILGNPIPTDGNWSGRRAHFLERVTLYDSIGELIELAHSNRLSLAAFKPRKLTKFVDKPVNPDWSKKVLDQLVREKAQLSLFNDDKVEDEIKLAEKIPFKFSYKYLDESGKERTAMIEDWEIGALYRNCLKISNGDKQKAVEMVRHKYWDEFVLSGKYDITLLMGTTWEFHNKRAPNPFVIVGVFYPPKDSQERLF